MRYKLIVSYFGTLYAGFQKQTGKDTIQQRLEHYLSNILHTPITTFVASRTDKGVHAYGNVVIFDYEHEINTSAVLIGLNKGLPKDIRVLSLVQVKSNFACRKEVKEKVYLYKIATSNIEIQDVYSYGQYKGISLSLLKEASTKLIGQHDFAAFTSGLLQTDPIKTIYSISVTEKDGIICIEFRGNSFLKYMIRKMVGLLLEISTGKKEASVIDACFETKQRNLIGITADPNGLYLVEINYLE